MNHIHSDIWKYDSDHSKYFLLDCFQHHSGRELLKVEPFPSDFKFVLNLATLCDHIYNTHRTRL